MKPRGRRSGGLDDDLIAIFAELPWWSVPIAAALIFALIAWLLPTVFPAHTAADRVSIGHLLLTPTYAAVAAGLIALLGLVGQVERGRRRRLFGTNQNLDAVRGLSWQDFERWVGEAYRRQGFEVAETATGADGGVDLVLRRGGETTYVQCKHWRASKVDVRPVRELFGVMASGGAKRGVVVTAGRFTTAAISEAEGKPIALIGGNNLLRLLGNAPDAGPELAMPAASGATAPSCPRCGSAMLVRQARRGDSPGSLFWGCPRFPKFRGTREMPG